MRNRDVGLIAVLAAALGLTFTVLAGCGLDDINGPKVKEPGRDSTDRGPGQTRLDVPEEGVRGILATVLPDLVGGEAART